MSSGIIKRHDELYTFNVTKSTIRCTSMGSKSYENVVISLTQPNRLFLVDMLSNVIPYSMHGRSCFYLHGI